MNICSMTGHQWKDLLYKRIGETLYHIWKCERCGEVRQEDTKIVLGLKNIPLEIHTKE